MGKLTVKVIADKKGLVTLKKRINEIRQASLEVGFYDELHPTATWNGARVSVAQVAKWSEEGTGRKGGWVAGSMYGNQPPRPFLKPSVELFWNNVSIGQYLRRLLKMNSNVKLNLAKIGSQTVNVVQTTIDGYTTPRNAPLTISLKGQDNPLTHTGFMRNSVKYKVY